MDLFGCLTAVGEGYKIVWLISSAPASPTRVLEFSIQLLPFVFSMGCSHGLMSIRWVQPWCRRMLHGWRWAQQDCRIITSHAAPAWHHTGGHAAVGVCTHGGQMIPLFHGVSAPPTPQFNFLPTHKKPDAAFGWCLWSLPNCASAFLNIESLRLERTSKIIKSNCQPITTMPTTSLVSSQFPPGLQGLMHPA